MILLRDLIYERDFANLPCNKQRASNQRMSNTKGRDFDCLGGFILEDTGINLLLLAQKPLFYVRPQDDSLVIFLVLPLRVSIILVLNSL